jgi:hypothetical protein
MMNYILIKLLELKVELPVLITTASEAKVSPEEFRAETL